jgi:uncharacterized protein YciI
MKIVNYATYVPDKGKVDASRVEHVAYADTLREHDRLVMGGPLLDDDGRARGVLLVYEVQSKQQAETLVQSDPFVQQDAIASYHLSEWTVLNSNVQALAAAVVTAEQRTGPKAPHADTAVEQQARDTRLYVNYAKYVSDHARIERVRPVHRAYAKSIREKGVQIMAGPFADDSGALLIYRTHSKEEAMALILDDPYYAEGVYEATTLSEWRLFGLNTDLVAKR